MYKNYKLFIIIVIFLMGLYVVSCYDSNSLYEGYENDDSKKRCPNMLIQVGSNYYLYNSNLAKVPGVNPVRFNNYKVFNKVTETVNACWFGMHTNHDTIINELSNLDQIDLNINLSIISNSFEEIDRFIKKKNFKNIKLKLINWHNRSDKDIVTSDVVLLPYPDDDKRLVKSSNRIIESLNLGRFTILSNVNQFLEFKNFTYFGDITSGLKWFLTNNEEAIKKTIDGQKYVLDKYSLVKICNSWANLLEKTI